MVMADRYGREQDILRRKPRLRDYDYDDRGPADNFSSVMKTPVILAKPHKNNQHKKAISVEREPVDGLTATNDYAAQEPPDSSGVQPVLLRRKNGNISTASSASSLASMVVTPGPDVTSVKTRVMRNTMSKLAIPPIMTRSVKIIDGLLSWTENGCEVLLDHTDYLVVGVLGLQGSGKSTLLSHLASWDTTERDKRSFVFKAEARDTAEDCAFMTGGIDMFVTQERTIYLDVQPMLSTSVLDNNITQDGKYSNDYLSPDNSVEMQSMQLATFLLTVCNVILVVSDGNIDINLLKFLRMAEMLKPATPNLTYNGVMWNEYYPHIVFVKNKAEVSDFRPTAVKDLCATVSDVMRGSKLHYTGMPGMMTNKLGWFAGSTVRGNTDISDAKQRDNINYFILPDYNLRIGKGYCPSDDQLTGYHGNPGYDDVMSELRRQLLSMPRRSLAHTSLSEKNWYHYCARTWDSVRKHQLLSEYSRLLS